MIQITLTIKLKLIDKNVKIEKNLIERKNKLVKSYKNIF